MERPTNLMSTRDDIVAGRQAGRATPDGGDGPDPAATIVIPAYNAEAYLPEALASAQEQTLREIEILVVDDGSTDRTWEIAGAFAARDARVRPLRRARRGGPSAACNDGIAAARGRWVVVLDADDLMVPERAERLVARGEALGADLIADNLLQREFETDVDLGPLFEESALAAEAAAGPLTLADMLRLDMPDLPGRARLGYLQPVKRRGFLARTGVRFAEDVVAGEDFLFYFDCVARGARFHLSPEAGYVYRVRRNSISGNGASAARHYSAANRRMLAIATALGDRALVATLRRRQAMLDHSSFVCALEARRWREALRHARFGSGAEMMSQLRTLRDVLRGAAPSLPQASKKRTAPG
jgi:glycosyltransferase involved in cell wall biosynthesis